jgi:4-hydroxy-2-oxoheptanedioate aldolase
LDQGEIVKIMKKRNSSLKERLKKGDVVAGPWCVIPSPSVIDIIAKTGADFVIIDMEHGPHNYETVVDMVRTAENEGCSSLIRVAKNDESHILHALDIGAEGVIVPHIQSRADAESAIAAAKYHPLGSRGFSPYTRAGGYSRHDIESHCSVQNRRSILCLILEGKEGTENLDDILAIDNIQDVIDIIYIGAYDLSQALGLPGQVDHPDVRATLETSIRKIRGRGVAAGGYVAKNSADMTWMCDIGMQFVTLLPDCTIIYHAFEDLYQEFVRVKRKKEGQEKR